VIRPNPPAARAPRYIRWYSSLLPSTERYIVIGDMAMRLRRVTPLRVYGLNRSGFGVDLSGSSRGRR
jgi:hypothetical protein